MIRLKKELIAMILGISIIFTCIPSYAVKAENSTSSTSFTADYIGKTKDCLWIDGASKIESKGDAISWWYNNVDEKYYLYLPAGCDSSNLKVFHSFDGDVTVDGHAITNNKTTDAFSNEGEHILKSDDKSYTVVVMKNSELSSVFLTTDEHDLGFLNSDKSNTDSGNVLITKADGSVDYDNTFSKIKGRGNTTWEKEKKPYNLTLDKKAGLLGMDSSKKWCLLSNWNDASLLRNQVAYDLSYEASSEFSSNSRLVNLYINGEYEGVYQLCEKVEAGKNNLVKINDLENATEKLNDNPLNSYEQGGSLECVNGTNKYFNIPNNPEDITGGYLLEYEMVSRYKDEPCGFVTKLGQPIICKAPSAASKEQVEYISSFFQDFESALNSEDGYNEKGKHYSDYVDIPSLTRMYFIQELSKNVDVALTSFYFYKDSDLNGDGKLHAAPAWDFDIAFGNYNDTITDERSPEGLLVPTTYIGGADWNVASSVPTIYTQLFKHQEFVDECCKEWTNNFYDKAQLLLQDSTSGTKRLKSINEYKNMLNSSAKMNFTRWDIAGDNLTGVYEGENYDDIVNYLYDFLKNRINYLDKVYRENGGKGEEAVRNNDDKTVKVYFDNSIAKWEDVCVSMYTYNGSLPFQTIKMDKVEGTNDLYCAEVSTVNDDIFFNTSRWDKKSNTIKEPLGSRNCYKMFGSEDGSLGRWCTFEKSFLQNQSLKLTTSTTSWDGGYQVDLKLKNESQEATNGWTLKIKDSNLNITNYWCVDYKKDGGYLIITPKDWNSKIEAGQTINFGLQGFGTADNNFEYELSYK